MNLAATLGLYVGRQFSVAVAGMLAALSGLVALFDYIELLRRAATKPDASFGLVTEIAVLRLPTSRCRSCPSRCCSAASWRSGALPAPRS